MTLYKVIDKEHRSCHGGSFDWTDYLPGPDGSPGKWTPKTPAHRCVSGYHVTPYPNMWFADDCLIYEVECAGLVPHDDSLGVNDKLVCESLRLIRVVDYPMDGRQNTGNRNTGNRNTGNRNTGDSNTGDRNTGDSNTGDRNTGDSNTGDSNTGDSNTGEWNTGDRNTGHRNTGHRNTGHLNTGDRNTGHRNTGEWNKSSCNTGAFNSTEPETVRMFNREYPAADYREVCFPDWFYFSILDDDPTLHKSWREAFNKASGEDVKAATLLPNFDYAVFEDITGISRVDIEEKIRA